VEKPTESQMTDFDFQDHGSITTVTALTDRAYDHLTGNVSDEAQWLGGALAVEPRYAPDLAADLCREGFTVELPDGRTVTAADLRENA
jgi:hypothetical protein